MDKKIEDKKAQEKQSSSETQKPKVSAESKKESNKNKQDPKDQKITELTNDLKRVQADFSNRSKQMDKEKNEFVEYASCNILCKILPIIDEMEIALKNMKEEDKKGVQMILTKMKKLLSEEEVTEIKCLGKTFDPYKHEVLQSEQGKEDGKILKELQKGYELKGKVLRSSKVKISRLSNGSAPNKVCRDSKHSMEGEQK